VVLGVNSPIYLGQNTACFRGKEGENKMIFTSNPNYPLADSEAIHIPDENLDLDRLCILAIQTDDEGEEEEE